MVDFVIFKPWRNGSWSPKHSNDWAVRLGRLVLAIGKPKLFLRKNIYKDVNRAVAIARLERIRFSVILQYSNMAMKNHLYSAMINPCFARYKLGVFFAMLNCQGLTISI